MLPSHYPPPQAHQACSRTRTVPYQPPLTLIQMCRDVPGGPVVKILPQCRGVWVQSLVRERRLHKPHGQNKQTKPRKTEATLGLPWGHSIQDSTCQCRRQGSDLWSGKIPHAVVQLTLRATATEPECPRLGATATEPECPRPGATATEPECPDREPQPLSLSARDWEPQPLNLSARD